MKKNWLSKTSITLAALFLMYCWSLNSVMAADTITNLQSTSPNPVAELQTPKVTLEANTPVITFSEFPVGTSISTQYQNLGIIFGGSGAFITNDGANPTSPVLSGTPLFTGNITGTFVKPTDGSPSTATSFSLDAGYFDAIGSVVLSWFDSSGNLIGTQQNSTLGIEHFTVISSPPEPGIAKWEIGVAGSEPAGFAIDNVSMTISSPSVHVDDANLSTNNIDITLSGLGSLAPAPLDIELTGKNISFKTSFNNEESVGDGTYSIILDRPSIPEGDYEKIIVTWKLSTGDITSQDYLITPVWRVLGLVRHSQYNTPAEVACSGTSQTAWVFDTNCNFIQTTLNSRFVTQTYINGTGRSIQHGVIKYSKLCPQKSYPNGASTRNSFLLVNEITGSCNRQMTNTYQAAYPNPAKSSVKTPKCGDNTLLVENNNNNKAEKQIQDYCPACKDGHHIDNYTDEEACSGSEIGDLGNFWTANIGR